MRRLRLSSFSLPFTLPTSFVDSYRSRPAPFGFNGLGSFVFERTYSRDDNPRLPYSSYNEGGHQYESWADVCQRVIEAMFSLQQSRQQPIGRWDVARAQASAREAFDLMFNLKWSPPGRGMWTMGTPFVHERGNPEASQNCAFISTRFLPEEGGDQFAWVMNMLMMGVGVGFDVFGAGLQKLYPNWTSEVVHHVVEDSREGWADLIRVKYDSYTTPGGPRIVPDVRNVRPYGTRIAGFGGQASGAAPLLTLFYGMESILDERSAAGQAMTITDICDVMNMIGRCVIAGNVRRSAEIALGPATREFLDLKNPTINSARMRSHGWASNNSILIEEPSDDYDYTEAAEMMFEAGEPGLFWLKNAREFGRMNGVISDKPDLDVDGCNPCGEQMLAHRELCTLVELYLPRMRSKEEFLRSIKYAYMYGKTVALMNEQINDPKSREVMIRHNRIGLSTTGYAQFLGSHTAEELISWLDDGYEEVQRYDRIYSSWLGINESIRTTSIKPSGTASLLPGVTPGVHFPISRFYKRRVQVSSDSHQVEMALRAGYTVEPDALGRPVSHIVFPVDVGPNVRAAKDVTLEEQVAVAALAARHWADNNPSFTGMLDADRDSVESLARLLQQAQYQFKAVSFLPSTPEGVYPQMPYETIDESTYGEMSAQIHPELLTGVGHDVSAEEAFCNTDVCELPELETAIV